jgi:Cytochrome P460
MLSSRDERTPSVPTPRLGEIDVKRLAAACLLATFAAGAFAADGKVSYPREFRDWRHVKSMVIESGHPLHESLGGMHHVYANKKALAGYPTGNFENGAVIVLDAWETVEEHNTIAEEQRKAVAVMRKDTTRFKATDGWGYELFARNGAEGSLDAKGMAECHACHKYAQQHGFVYSELRD